MLKTYHSSTTFYNIYRTIPRKSINNVSENDFYEEFQDLLSYCNLNTNSKTILVGDFNIHFDPPCNLNTKKILDLFEMFDLVFSQYKAKHKFLVTL